MANTKKPTAVKQEIVKKTRTRHDLENFGAENVKPGDNARYLRYSLAAWDLPPIDLDSNEQVEERIKWFFRHCMECDMKPTVTGLANALGVDRRTLYDWKTGNRRGANFDRAVLVKKAYNLLEEMWENYMLNGKVNPPSGIFIGKNHFGYVDELKLTATASQPLGENLTAEEAAKKYQAALPDVDFDGE